MRIGQTRADRRGRGTGSDDPGQRRRRRGAALVETAIVLPVFFLVVLGIIEFGRAFMVMQLVNTAAREACRSAVADNTDNDAVTSFVKNMVSETVSIPQSDVDVEIEITPYPGNADPDDHIEDAGKRDTVRIDVTVDYADVSFMVPKFLANAKIRGTSIMRHE